MTNTDDIDETIEETERVLAELEGDEPDDAADDASEPPTADSNSVADTPEAEETPDRATEAGENLGDAVRETSANALVRFMTGFSSVVPFRARLMKKLMLGATYKYWKLSGGDALGLRARPNGQIAPTPVKWKDAIQPLDEVGQERQKPGWKVKNEDRAFGPGAEGRNVDWFGKTPVILLDDDNPEKFNTLDARISECLEDPERVDALFESAEINVTGMIDKRRIDAESGQQAVADGGTVQVEDHYDVLFGSIGRGRLKDKLIDVSSGEGFDGMRVSWRKVQEQRHEQTTTEEMQNQEVRGWLAGKAGDDHSDLVKKLMLYFILAVLGLVAIIFLGPPLLTGDSIVPSLSLLPVGGL